MRLMIYGDSNDKVLTEHYIRTQKDMMFRKIEILQEDNYEMFLEKLREREVDIVIVTKDNAQGMEGVIATKNINPNVQVVWISNDENFGAQSYRLGVAYFTVKPLDEKKMKLAMDRCRRREAKR